MSATCGHNSNFEGVSSTYKRILWIIIGINAVMFFVEISAGLTAKSQALQADALDFLADSITYAISLLVIGKSIALRSKAALFKGISLSFMGLSVMGLTLYRMLALQTPEAVTMGSVAFLALLANLISVALLVRYRNGDANVRSVWLCSRNDAISNLVVIIAASGVWMTSSAWPDLIVALLMGALFLSSSVQIIRQARKEMSNEAAVSKYSA